MLLMKISAKPIAITTKDAGNFFFKFKKKRKIN